MTTPFSYVYTDPYTSPSASLTEPGNLHVDSYRDHLADVTIISEFVSVAPRDIPGIALALLLAAGYSEEGSPVGEATRLLKTHAARLGFNIGDRGGHQRGAWRHEEEAAK